MSTHSPELHYFCDNPNCRNHVVCHPGIHMMNVLDAPPPLSSFRETATEKMMAFNYRMISRSWLVETMSGNTIWRCSDCCPTMFPAISSGAINPAWVDAPYTYNYKPTKCEVELVGAPVKTKEPVEDELLSPI